MLQELFNVLDLPGSSVRDVLAGENPFDQWTSPLSDDHRTSGAKLVNRWTGADENSWGGMIGGMGAEMLLDPMNLLPGFGVMKRALTAKRVGGLNRGIRAANEAQQALDAGRYGFVNANRLAGGADEAAEAAGPLQQKLLGYDPGVTENYQSISHGTSNPFAGSDDFPAGKLDLRYMGTGEGNQAFGWGSYSAQDPGVAATYEQYGGGGRPQPSYKITGLGRAVMREAQRRASDPGTVDKIRKEAPLLFVMNGREDQYVQSALSQAMRSPHGANQLLEMTGEPEWLRQIKQARLESSPEDPFAVSSLFEREILPPEVPEGPFHVQLNLPKEAEDRMIRGDMDFHGQPPLVQQSLSQVFDELSPISKEWLSDQSGHDIITSDLLQRYQEGALQDPLSVAAKATPGEVDRKVAEYLQSKGIVGNKFLDRKSRDVFGYFYDEYKRGIPEIQWSGVREAVNPDVKYVAQSAVGAAHEAGADITEVVEKAKQYLRDNWEEFKDEDPKYAQASLEALSLFEKQPPAVSRAKPPSLDSYTSNYAIWDQPTLDKTRIRKVNGVNIPLANMLKGGRARPTEVVLDLVQSTQPMGSPLMQELPVPSLLSRKEALALGIYNVAARGGFTVE